MAYKEMTSFGAERAEDGNGSEYDGLCQSGGTYTVIFSQTHGVVVFCSKHSGFEWKTGDTYKVGDIMLSNGYVFVCLRAHTTGTTSRTRDPSLRSNKSTWEVIGFSDGPLEYSSTVRYEVGFEVVYKGMIYARKDFNLVGGQVPYENKSSDYWELVATAP